jgi:hypothetical protein
LIQESTSTEDERAARAGEFQQILDRGLGSHLVQVEKELTNMLVKSRSQKQSDFIRAQIMALRHCGDFITRSIAEGEVSSQNLKRERQLQEGKRRPWH